MAHYDIYREELARNFQAFGHALWEPSPGILHDPVAIGDVGFIREGKFHRIFNVLLPEDDQTHENFGVMSMQTNSAPTTSIRGKSEFFPVDLKCFHHSN